jgi:hypothetical protein
MQGDGVATQIQRACKVAALLHWLPAARLRGVKLLQATTPIIAI